MRMMVSVMMSDKVAALAGESTLAANASLSALPVLALTAVEISEVRRLLARFGLHLEMVPEAASIPGSYWGDSEAGLVGNYIYARRDTPLHSLLHEASHYVCMDSVRRQALHTDAGGDFDEENAVCYLQIVLAEYVQGLGEERMLSDMDVWGYTFRLGSARAWFEQEALSARQWLQNAGLIDHEMRPMWRVRL